MYSVFDLSPFFALKFECCIFQESKKQTTWKRNGYNLDCTKNAIESFIWLLIKSHFWSPPVFLHYFYMVSRYSFFVSLSLPLSFAAVNKEREKNGFAKYSFCLSKQIFIFLLALRRTVTKRTLLFRTCIFKPHKNCLRCTHAECILTR